MKPRKGRPKLPVALPPLPEGVAAEDIGRALVRQIKPVRPKLVVNRKRKREDK